METLIISALLLLALVPSLLPTWRSALLASGCFLALLFLGFISVLWHFGAASEEGPAFAGLVILVGLTAFVLASSCAIRLVISLTLGNLDLVNAVRFRLVLMTSGLVVAALAVFGTLEFSVHRGFAIMVASASVWLVVVTWLAPNNSLELKPHHGSA